MPGPRCHAAAPPTDARRGPAFPKRWPADSGRPKGFGFIEFLDIRDAEEAIYNLDRTMFGGREIQVRAGWAVWCGQGRTMCRADCVQGPIM